MYIDVKYKITYWHLSIVTTYYPVSHFCISQMTMLVLLCR